MTAKALAEMIQCIENTNETLVSYNKHIAYDLNTIKALLKDVPCDDKGFISDLEKNINSLAIHCQGFSDRIKHLIMKSAKE